MVKWDDLQTLIYPLISYLGPYIGIRQEVSYKLLRLILIFLEEEKSKLLANWENCNFKKIIIEISLQYSTQ